MDKRKLDEWILHLIEIENENSFEIEILKEFDLLTKDVVSLINSFSFITTKAVLLDLIDEISLLIENFNNKCNEKLDIYTKDVIERESDWLLEFCKSLGLSIVIPKLVNSKLKFFSFASDMTYTDFVESTTSDLIKKITSALKISLLTKLDNSHNSEVIQSKVNTARKHFETDLSTFKTGIHRLTDFLILRHNNQKVVYSAILDTSVCLVCANNNGVVFDIDKAPILPIHRNCRCSLIPFGSNEEPVDMPSFEDWIKDLPDEEKKKVLGKTRFNLYKQGISAKSFVKNNLIVKLSDLK